MKEIILNHQNEKICVDVLVSQVAHAPVVFIEHGLAGYKEENVVQIPAAVFAELGFTVVTFDARYNLGESDGPLEKANFTHFIEDLQTVIEWAKTQTFYCEPFMLCGHSLGAGAALWYASHHPQAVKGIFSLSAVISGKLLLDSYQTYKPDFVRQWQNEKRLYREHPSIPARNGFISYDHINDAMRYHLTDIVQTIKCPVLIVCGSRDISSTIAINQALFEALRSPKELYVVENAGHTYAKPEHENELSQVIKKWGQSYFNR